MQTSYKGFQYLFVFILLLLLPVLACGESVEPERVGTVEEDEATVVEDSTVDGEDAEANVEVMDADVEEGGEASDAGEETQTEAEIAAETEEETASQPETTAETEEEVTPGTATFQVGDVIEMGDVVMTVLGWESPEGDSFTAPEEGNRFVIVDAILVNRNEQPIQVSSLLQMELRDGEQNRYDVDFMASTAADASGIDGEISPGERVRGSTGFQVPAGAEALTFVFEPSFWDVGKIFVALPPEPTKMEPPATLAGEKEQELYQVQEVISLGEMEFVVNEVLFPAGGDFNQPEPGKRFVVVDLSVTNRGTETRSVSSLLQTSVKDSTGQSYDIDLMASTAVDKSTLDGDVLPGETLRGIAGFQVPIEATDLVFVYDADVWGTGKVNVALPAPS